MKRKLFDKITIKSSLCSSFLILLSACSTAPLPQEKRELKYIVQTSLKQKEAYNLALSYLAKNLGDSNLAIKVKDPESGTIITQIAFDCSELKDFMDPNRHSPLFNLEVGTKDNKVRFVFEAVKDRIFNGVDNSFILDRGFTNESQVQSLKHCTEKMKTEILKAMSNQKASNW